MQIPRYMSQKLLFAEKLGTLLTTLMFVMLKNPDKILVQLVMIVLFLGILVSKWLLYINIYHTGPNG